MFSSLFEHPDDSEKLYVVRFTDCASQFSISDWSLEESELLKNHRITIDDFNGIIVLINQKISPYRQKLVLQTKIMMGYIVVGLLLLSIMAVLLGVLVSYWISLGLIVLYFVGLIIIQRITSRV